MWYLVIIYEDKIKYVRTNDYEFDDYLWFPDEYGYKVYFETEQEVIEYIQDNILEDKIHDDVKRDLSYKRNGLDREEFLK